MPVPIERLKEAQRPLRERIIEVLRADPRNAFSLPEIWQRVEGVHGEDAFSTVLNLDLMTWQTYAGELLHLVAEGLLTSATIAGTVYYAAADAST